MAIKAGRMGRGFTLLEVLVATAVFAIAALALLNAQNTQLTTDQRLETKTLAHWVALNQLADMRLQKVFPDIGESTINVKMAERDWVITIKTQGTPAPGVRLLQLSVAQKSGASADAASPVTVVTGFLARTQAQNAATTPAS
ncbi:MAG: type II secretion system minor pseudopilin GspI [bacterium]|nr:type II secretion system minor pseudopilin GspI [bacterium]